MAFVSNTLFHFTSKLDNIKGILSEGFRVNYCAEIVKFSKRRHGVKFFVPMVSRMCTFKLLLKAYAYASGVS